MSVATDLAREEAALARRVEFAEQRAATAEALRRRAEQQLVAVQDAGKHGQQQLAKQTVEAATALLVSGIVTYIAMAADPQHARSRLQSYLSARLHPAIGAPIPELPWGPDAEL